MKNKQQERWEAEYAKLEHLPSSRTMQPSRALVEFFEAHPDVQGAALDVGAGKGRNCIYLAQNGFEVAGVEFARTAVMEARRAVEAAGVGSKVKLLEQSAGERLPFSDASFDVIADMMMLHLLNEPERNVYRREVIRLLKPGGYFVLYTIAADSPAAQALCAASPGPEPNSYVIPQSGMVEKGFTNNELTEMFAPLKALRLDRITEYTPAFGDEYERVYISGVMKSES